MDYYEQFKKPFPKEAYSIDSSRGFNLTSIRAQYIIERLNDVLGVTGWTLTGEHRDDGFGGVLYFGKLSVRISETNHEICTVGHCAKKKNIGDMYKSAATDCLSKAASRLGIGNEVFKGNVDPGKVEALPSENNSNGGRSGASNEQKEADTDGLGKYKITFGKYTGRTLDQIAPNILRGYIGYLDAQASKNNTTKKLIEAAQKYMNSGEVDGPLFTTDDIPF